MYLRQINKLWLASVAVALSLGFGMPIGAQDQGHYDSSEVVGPTGMVIPISLLGKSTAGVEVQPIQKKLLPLELTTLGKIETIPTREYSQHSPVSGRISEVLVNLGDKVQKGQSLVKVESPELNKVAAQILQDKQEIEAQIAQEKTALDDQVNECQARIQLARATYDRDARLVEEQIGSQKSAQNSLANLEVAQAQLKAATSKRELVLKALATKLKLTLEPLRQQMRMLGTPDTEISTMLNANNTITVAPVRSMRAGVITSVNCSAGQGIDPAVKLFTVSDLTRVFATANIYEDDMSRVHLGQKVKIRVSALANEHFDGVLSYIGDHVDMRTRTLPVRAELDNTDLRLKPDMYAELIIQINAPSLSIMLPEQAVVSRNGHSLVFIEVPGGYQPTRVRLGRSFGDTVEVIDGVEQGQPVVVHGAFPLAAEMLKVSGSTEMFDSAMEGDHESTELVKEKPGGLNISPQVIAVSIAIAFILGFCISAMLAKLRRHKHTASTKATRREGSGETEHGTDAAPARQEKT